MSRSRLSAPREDRAILAVPDFSAWQPGTIANRSESYPGATICGVQLDEVRSQARADVLVIASDYMKGLGEAVPADVNPASPLIVTGHQPELFHAGVWVKSFAANRLAERVGGWSLQFLADADTVKQTAIRVPSGGMERPILANAPFDRWTTEVPHEEREVADEGVFADFGDRVAEDMKDLSFRPIVRDYWSRVMAGRDRTRNLGERLAIGRRSFEAELGYRNFEAPLSRLCGSRAFWLLAADIVLRATSFRANYNAVLADYRRLHGVRSRNHPASDLAADGNWVEAPFWVWSGADTRRRPLWVETGSDRLLLRAGDTRIGSLSHDAASAIDDLRQAVGEWKLRPRALTTTLFVRLLLADWFVHGIGGGKYDEVTDELMRRCFGVAPPAYGVMTATVLLPGADPDRGGGKLRALRRERRDTYWNPDRHLDDSLREREPLAGWIERKFELQRASPANRLDRRQRFEDLRLVNDRLRPYVSARIQTSDAELAAQSDQDRARGAYASREFAFCLHPRSTIDWLAHCLD